MDNEILPYVWNHLTYDPTSKVIRQIGPDPGSHGELIRFDPNKIIGQGGFGVVFLGMLGGDNTPVAVKRCRRVPNHVSDYEVNVMVLAQGHPNILRYYSHQVTVDFV